METRWNLGVLKNQHCFDKPGVARRGFQMAKIGFYRTHRKWRVDGSITAESFRKSVCLDRIAILERPRKSLEQDHASAFTTHNPAGGCIEGGAPALGRKHRSLRKPDKPARRNHHSDASRQGNVSTPGPDVLARRVNCGERG